MVREDEGDTAKWGDAEYLISLAKGWDKQRDISDVEWISAVLEVCMWEWRLRACVYVCVCLRVCCVVRVCGRMNACV